MENMLKYSDFHVESLQSTIFTPDIMFSQSKILSFMLNKWGDIFDDDPISLPSAPEMPIELSRILLQNKNKKYKIEISPSRINFFCLKINNEEVNINEFYKLSNDIFCSYKEIITGRVGRLASVIHRAIKIENPGRILANYFCKENWIKFPFNNSEGFEIHSHKRYKLSDSYNINSWIRFKTAVKGKDRSLRDFILVEQDLNTFPEKLDKNDYSNTQIGNFFNLAKKEFDSVFLIFFPSGG